MTDDTTKILDQMHAAFNFFRAHPLSLDPKQQAMLDTYARTLDRTLCIVRESSETTRKLGNLSEELILTRQRLLRAQAALAQWDAIFISDVSVIQSTAGQIVADAVVATRRELRSSQC